MYLVGELNWFRVADWFEHDTCQSHRHYGYCCHPHRKAGNPCDRTQSCADACKAIAMGQKPEVDIDDIIKRAAHFHCRHHNCHHAACVEIDKVVAWLRQAKIALKAA